MIYKLFKNHKILFSLAVVFLNSSLSFSQDKKFIPGINLGLNTSQVSGDDLAGFDQFGIYGGLSVMSQINENTTWQFQIAFSQKGSRKPSNPNGNNSIYVIRLNYIDVPFIISTRIAKKWLEDISLEVGIVNSYLINYVERNTFGNVFPVRPFDKYELSGLIGINYSLKENILFSLRYFNSILPIRSHPSNATYLWNRGQYNSVLQFNFAYLLK